MSGPGGSRAARLSPRVPPSWQLQSQALPEGATVIWQPCSRAHPEVLLVGLVLEGLLLKLVELLEQTSHKVQRLLLVRVGVQEEGKLNTNKDSV